MLRRLLNRNIVVQGQQMARSLNCYSNCLLAKYGVPSSCQKWGQLAESVAERGTRPPVGSFPTTLDLCDRFPQGPLREPRQLPNLLSQRRSVDPSRLQYVKERHQRFIAEAELRQLNAKPIVRWDGRNTARWEAKNT